MTRKMQIRKPIRLRRRLRLLMNLPSNFVDSNTSGIDGLLGHCLCLLRILFTIITHVVTNIFRSKWIVMFSISLCRIKMFRWNSLFLPYGEYPNLPDLRVATRCTRDWDDERVAPGLKGARLSSPFVYHLHQTKEMTTDCTHISRLATLSGPKLSQQVHREECTQCFDNQVR